MQAVQRMLDGLQPISVEPWAGSTSDEKATSLQTCLHVEALRSAPSLSIRQRPDGSLLAVAVLHLQRIQRDVCPFSTPQKIIINGLYSLYSFFELITINLNAVRSAI
jgi:hypothetical protein